MCTKQGDFYYRVNSLLGFTYIIRWMKYERKEDSAYETSYLG